MAEAPPVLRTLTVEYGVDNGWLVIRAGGREDRVIRVVDAERSALAMDALERWLVYRVGNAAYELADRLRTQVLSRGPSAAPSVPPEMR